MFFATSNKGNKTCVLLWQKRRAITSKQDLPATLRATGRSIWLGYYALARALVFNAPHIPIYPDKVSLIARD